MSPSPTRTCGPPAAARLGRVHRLRRPHLVQVAALYSRFLYVESCSQCPPCKLGSGEITERLERIEAGGGEDVDIEQIGGWLRRVTDGSRCYLATEEQVMVSSVLGLPRRVTEHVEESGAAPGPARCPCPRSSSSTTAGIATTSRSGASAPTGPTRTTERRQRGPGGCAVARPSP